MDAGDTSRGNSCEVPVPSGGSPVTGTAQYLLAIYIVEHRQSPPVSFGSVAEVLDRSPASVTEMCKRLDEEGLVDHEPYEGVALTERGREEADQLHETYVTLSWFFRSVLELEAYEREAMEMAGTVSPDVARRLAATLSEDGAADEELGVDGSPG